MVNPYNCRRSLLQLIYGVAGLPWTLSGMHRAMDGGELLVLCYHRVSRTPVEGEFCGNHLFINLPEKIFVRQIRWLVRHYRVVGLDEVLSGSRLPNRAALITFDDGFIDTYETAWPVLNAFRLPATIFLIGSVVREGKIPWTTRLHWLLDHAREKGLRTACPGLPERNGRRGDTAGVLAAMTAALKGMDMPEIDGCLSCLEDRLGMAAPLGLCEERFMGEAQIRDLCRSGWMVGNHTDHHLNLASLAQGRVEEEIGRAGDTLSTFPGYRPVLSIPFGLAGSFTPATADAARRCGMRHLFTTQGSPNPLPASRVLLDRVISETFSGLYFRFLASGGRSAARRSLARLGLAHGGP